MAFSFILVRRRHFRGSGRTRALLAAGVKPDTRAYDYQPGSAPAFACSCSNMARWKLRNTHTLLTAEHRKGTVARETQLMLTLRFSRLSILVGLTVVYFLAGKLGLRLAFVHASASPVWPPAGIALGAMLVLGYRTWPAVFMGAFLVNLT